MSDTLEQLKQLIKDEYHLDTSTVTLDSALADVGLDSLAVAELLFSIEESFKIDLGDVSPDAVPTVVGQVVALIDGKRAPAAAA